MWTTRRFALNLVLIGALGLGLACADDDNPDDRTEDELNALTIRPDAPLLERTDTFFYARKGEDREVAIYFTDGAGGRGTIFFLLRVFANSLMTRPDGTPIADGDSVRISVRVVDPTRVLFDVQPNGLSFNPAAPAELLLHYNEVDPDLDGDGDVDAADAALELRLFVWRQEAPGQLFLRLPSVVNPALDGVQAFVPGFTRFAVAY